MVSDFLKPISKVWIRVPRLKRDYISNLIRLKYASRRPVNWNACVRAYTKYVCISIYGRMHLNTIRSMLNQALRDNAALCT